MFNCQLCQEETCYVYKYCDNCQNVKRIMNCYGSKEVLAILNRVCLRNGAQQDYKIKKELKDTTPLLPVRTKSESEVVDKIQTRQKKKDKLNNVE